MLTLMTHRQVYIQTILNLYVRLPDTSPPARRRDRDLADRFFDRQIPIDLVETALLLGSARRIFRRPPPRPIRSLAYFEPLVEQLRTQALLLEDAGVWRFHDQPTGPIELEPDNDWAPPF